MEFLLRRWNYDVTGVTRCALGLNEDRLLSTGTHRGNC